MCGVMEVVYMLYVSTMNSTNRKSAGVVPGGARVEIPELLRISLQQACIFPIVHVVCDVAPGDDFKHHPCLRTIPTLV
jgi:hypothetical protein